MKYVIVIPDGCADEPQAELFGRTPLEAAKTPNLDRLAQTGVLGWANHTPEHLPAGSDVANLSLFGYDPQQYFTGRAPIEAAAQQIPLGPEDWVVRCNLVTIVDQTMQDFTAGHISTAEAKQLLQDLQTEIERHPEFAGQQWQFVPGVSYRNLLVKRGTAAPFSRDSRTQAPHDWMGQSVAEQFPRGPGSAPLCELMALSGAVFAEHPINQQRRQKQQLPATHVWLWGLGQAPQLPTFATRFGCRGAMITAVDLLRGLGRLMGWDCLEVPGATGYLDTNYRGKGQAACRAIEEYDVVCVHIEAPDEASHAGNLAEKVAAIEKIDAEIIGPIVEVLRNRREWRILVSPDHPTLLRTQTHSHGNVPFVMAGTGFYPGGAPEFGESVAESSDCSFPQGHQLMEFFINEKNG
jgi:2,3-bisphosphoglycerate-independent phosphoglycerate mutase